MSCRLQSAAVLATLDIADHTGCLERVLVGEAALCDLSAAEDKQALLRILDKEGPEGLCFRTQLDIRLATSSSMNKYRPATDSTAATTQQDSQDSDSKASSTTECQFQVLAAQPCLGKAYDAHSRPMIKKALRLAGSRPEGAVYPVSSVYTDVSYSGMGIKVNGAVIFPAFVTILARAKDAGELRRFGDQSDEHVLIQHAQVAPVDAAVAEEEFCVEAMRSFAQRLQYSMSDGTRAKWTTLLLSAPWSWSCRLTPRRPRRRSVRLTPSWRKLPPRSKADAGKFGRRPSSSSSSSFESFLTPFETRPGRRALCESWALTSC